MSKPHIKFNNGYWWVLVDDIVWFVNKSVPNLKFGWKFFEGRVSK